MKHVETALKQIDWQRSNEGSQYGNDPLLDVQRKMRDIRDGDENKLVESDYKLLLKSCDASIRKICNYEYGPNVDAEACRQFALQPIFDLKTEIAELRGQS